MGRSLHLFIIIVASAAGGLPSQGDTGARVAIFHISRTRHKDRHVLGCSQYYMPGKDLRGYASFPHLIRGVRQCCLSSVLEQRGVTSLRHRGTRDRKGSFSVPHRTPKCVCNIVVQMRLPCSAMPIGRSWPPVQKQIYRLCSSFVRGDDKSTPAVLQHSLLDHCDIAREEEKAISSSTNLWQIFQCASCVEKRGKPPSASSAWCPAGLDPGTFWQWAIKKAAARRSAAFPFGESFHAQPWIDSDLHDVRSWCNDFNRASSDLRLSAE